MKDMKLLCWNVNGIRSVKNKGFLDWLHKESPDVLCLQETKAQQEQLDEDLLNPKGYYTYWSFPQTKKGWSGVATYTREKPLNVQYGFGIEKFDVEGRIVIAEYPRFTLFNIYFPNGKKDKIRLRYKLEFYDAFLDYIEPLRERGDRLVVCGDFNTAHKEIDLARPKENAKYSGFLPIEREWMDKFASRGYTDTFRHFHKEPGQYSWWDLKSGARARNVGWRIDYFFVSENLLPWLKSAFIMSDVMGADHCPVGITLAVP